MTTRNTFRSTSVAHARAIFGRVSCSYATWGTRRLPLAEDPSTRRLFIRHAIRLGEFMSRLSVDKDRRSIEIVAVYHPDFATAARALGILKNDMDSCANIAQRSGHYHIRLAALQSLASHPERLSVIARTSRDVPTALAALGLCTSEGVKVVYACTASEVTHEEKDAALPEVRRSALARIARDVHHLSVTGERDRALLTRIFMLFPDMRDNVMAKVHEAPDKFDSLFWHAAYSPDPAFRKMVLDKLGKNELTCAYFIHYFIGTAHKGEKGYESSIRHMADSINLLYFSNDCAVLTAVAMYSTDREKALEAVDFLGESLAVRGLQQVEAASRMAEVRLYAADVLADVKAIAHGKSFP